MLAVGGDRGQACRAEPAAGPRNTTTGAVTPGFIASRTVVYTPTLHGPVEAPFIASRTTVYAPRLLPGEVFAPFISSRTRVYDVFSLFNPDWSGVGPGAREDPRLPEPSLSLLMQRIGLAMLVKDESEALPATLQRILPAVNAWTVMDTCPTHYAAGFARG